MPPAVRHEAQVSVWQKLKMGALMGAGVGLTIGFIFGGWSIIRGGAGPRGAMSTLSQYMLSSAATFSFFLSIGSVIRNDDMLPPHIRERLLTSQAAAISLRSRAEGYALIRQRWAKETQLETPVRA